MRYLQYTNYQSGASGLSNGIMSIEIGVVLAHLTNRLLVLEGNVSPPANVVSYDGRVNNQQPSRVTDLLDIPVPWVEPEAVDLTGLESRELTDRSLWDLVFYFPRTLDVSTEDARSFARGRPQWLTVAGADERVPVLRLTEQPLMPGTDARRRNLGYYSYQFYLDEELRRSVHRLLQGMQAKKPFAELAARVAGDLGRFNAVHLRRGDFKITYGVTTLDRKPWEAIEAMDQLFDRKDPLVIVTDERDDPFFREIKLTYPNHVFIDWHILDEYGEGFRQLPRSDSLSLAYLSQLVAAESQEFIGTMTSTFTGLIQRYRGNRGKDEAFRYLWNELTESMQGVERGRHAFSECIPLERGRMVEQFPGPYSWNRVSQLLAPSWMREWPESFLTQPTTRSAAPKPSAVAEVPRPAVALAATPSSALHVGFEDLQVALWAQEGGVLQQLAPELGALLGSVPRNVMASFDLSPSGATWCIQQRGLADRTYCEKAGLATACKQQIATVLARARHGYSWLAAAAFTEAGRALVVAGDVGAPGDVFRRTMKNRGWELLEGSLFAVRAHDLVIVPFGAQADGKRMATPLGRLVVANRLPAHARDPMVAPLSPAAAVARLIGASLDFTVDQDRAVNLLCRLVEGRPAIEVHWSAPEQAAEVVAHWADTAVEAAA